MRKIFVLVIFALGLSLVWSAPNWGTILNFYFVEDTLWGDTLNVDTSHATVDLPSGDCLIPASTGDDSTYLGIYIRIWARKMSNSAFPGVPDSSTINGGASSYSCTLYTPTHVPDYMAMDGGICYEAYSMGYIMNFALALDNIKQQPLADLLPFNFDDNDSLFIYFEDRFGTFSCYPDSGSQCFLFDTAWAAGELPITGSADIWDFFAGTHGILDSITWSEYYRLSDGSYPDPNNPCMRVGVHQKPPIPKFPVLGANSPNPFNTSTDIEFSLPEAENVSLVVTDVLGKHVKTLYNGSMSIGNHTIRWDALDEEGNEVPSGVYFYKLTVGDNFADKKKMTLLK